MSEDASNNTGILQAFFMIVLPSQVGVTSQFVGMSTTFYPIGVLSAICFQFLKGHGCSLQ